MNLKRVIKKENLQRNTRNEHMHAKRKEETV